MFLLAFVGLFVYLTAGLCKNYQTIFMKRGWGVEGNGLKKNPLYLGVDEDQGAIQDFFFHFL